MSDKPVVGFIGVGLMGHGMAKNILQGGYPLVIKANRNRGPVESLLGMGATEVQTAREMAAQLIEYIFLDRRPLALWIASANISLPVPLSPRISTGTSWIAAR